MNKEDYEKLSSFEKIDYDIAMKIYFEHNDRIASINDHLGEVYDYRDLQEAIDLEKDDELNEYKKALKEKCDAIDKAIELLNWVNELKTKYTNYNPREKDYLDRLLEILKGENNE